MKEAKRINIIKILIVLLPVLIVSIIQLLDMYIVEYSLIINRYVLNNSLLISAINTYSIVIFIITISFIPLIYMVKNKIFFEEFMEDNRKEFKNALLMSTFYPLLTFFISLFNLVYQTKIMINVMIVLFILETIPFIILTIVLYRFITRYLDINELD